MTKANTIKKNVVPELQQESENANRNLDRGFVNENNGSSTIIGEDGDFVVASGKNIQYKMNVKSGKSTQISYHSLEITNKKEIKTDELVFNKHKLNPQLWELTDYKRYNGDPTSAMGNLMMGGTVLVKTWEPTLKKWVLMRRPIITPVFSKKISAPDAPKAMGLSSDISSEINEINKLK